MPSPPAILLFVANLLIPIAILTFAKGFFPHKPFLPGRAQYYAEGHTPTPPFNKVIFMVIDALRSDFVYSNDSAFHFTQSLIRSGAAIPYTAHATAPTITMPRVKAITTGSIPSFLDVILNFAEADTSSILATQDTWPGQLQAINDGKLIMYGDDTWLKLFPGMFSRSDGTSSFFVSDFTEVDHNVTRHIPNELVRSDWNGMIMHYLGLDHIGHKSGPRSPHMIPKQYEMDSVVEQLFHGLETIEHLESTLLVVCGDHGMNDAGNHGGSSPGETSPALIFISPKLKHINSGSNCPIYSLENEFQYYDVVEQSDIAPTLAGLLGFPIPMNNLGVFISGFLQFWPDVERAWIINQNFQQVLRVIKAAHGDAFFEQDTNAALCVSPGSDMERLLCLREKIDASQADNGSNNNVTVEAMIEFLRNAQDIMSSSASNYDVSKLLLGIGLATIASMIALLAAKILPWNTESTWLWVGILTLTYSMMMFASSYVEEEHHFWYWAATGWLGWLQFKLCLRESKKRVTRFLSLPTLILINRIIRRWNQTGQKHAGESDIAGTYFFGHNLMLWTSVVVTFIHLTRRLTWQGLPDASRWVASSVAIVLCHLALSFKVAFVIADAPELLAGVSWDVWAPFKRFSLVFLARTIFVGIGSSAAFAIYQRIHRPLKAGQNSFDIAWSLHDLINLFLLIQSRVTNAPLFLLFYIELHILSSLDLDCGEITMTSIIFQYAYFFAFGGSNAISSIDLSNAYNGVSGYNIGAVGLLTFISNWAGPIWWVSASNLLLLEASRREQQVILVRHISLLTIFTGCSLTFVMAACTALRAHLFIWTVFSPKYVYIMAWSLGQHFCVNVVVGCLLYWVGY